jgi:hypothetical protein
MLIFIGNKCHECIKENLKKRVSPSFSQLVPEVEPEVAEPEVELHLQAELVMEGQVELVMVERAQPQAV